MFFLIVPIAFLFAIINGGLELSIFYVLLTWIALGLFYVVGFYLHYTYYQNDKNKKIKIDSDSNIIIQESDKIIEINNKDIETIINYQSGLNNKTPWNNYEFSVFKLKNGQIFIFSCLLLDINTIIDKFQEQRLIRKKYFIASLNKLQQPTRSKK